MDFSVSAPPAIKPTASIDMLFARASRKSDQVFLPVNASAQNADEKLPAFYCVHSVSGAAGMDFLDLAQRLDTTVRFFGIQAPPKRMDDVSFGDTIESLAEHYVECLINFQPSGPLLLGGYCVGAIIALHMANCLRARGREVSLLVAIDGAPENTAGELRRWAPRYWIELLSNLPGWTVHGDLPRGGSLKSVMSSVAKNLMLIAKAVSGRRRGQSLTGAYAMDDMMDLSMYPLAHRQFINRLFAAIFLYRPAVFAGDIVVYEAKTTPLLYLPQIGRVWAKLAPQTRVVRVDGTHIGIMHDPYIGSIAEDLAQQILATQARGTQGLAP